MLRYNIAIPDLHAAHHLSDAMHLRRDLLIERVNDLFFAYYQNSPYVQMEGFTKESIRHLIDGFFEECIRQQLAVLLAKRNERIKIGQDTLEML